MRAEQTTENGRPNLKPAAIAAVAASLLMLVFGVTHRVLVARLRLLDAVTTVPIDDDALDRLPMQIGHWIGQDVPLNERIIDTTDADALINRRYSLAGGIDYVSLYISAGVRVLRVMDHRPDICYVRNGWTMTDRRSVNRRLHDGTMLPCFIYEFSRGILGKSKIVVLYYFIADGRYCRDVSEWRYSYRNIRYVGQVEIAAPVREVLAGDRAVTSVSDFAADSAPEIMALFDHIGEGQMARRLDRDGRHEQKE